MSRLTLLPLLLLMFAGFWMLPSEGFTAADRLPLKARIVLTKVAPLLEQGKYTEAAEILSTFREKRKSDGDRVFDNPEINFALGNCYALTDRLKEAGECYRRVVEREPKHLLGWQNLAKNEYELEHYSAASAAFFKSYLLTAESREEEPRPDLLYYSGVALLMDQKYRESIAKFMLLTKKHPSVIVLEWKENFTYALLHDDKPRQALVYMVELANGFSGKKQQRWREILLQTYMSLDMYDKALLLVDKLVHQEPTQPLWWKGLVHIQLHEGDYKKALSAMIIYSKLAPLSPQEYRLLGDLYLDQGIPRKAASSYEQVISGKTDEAAMFNLVRAYRAIGQSEQALKKLDTFAGKLKKPEKLAMERAEILYSMKEYEKAAVEYENVGRLQKKEFGRAFLMAGYSYWQQEKFGQAVASFKAAEKSKKYSKEARRAIKELSVFGSVLPDAK